MIKSFFTLLAATVSATAWAAPVPPLQTRLVATGFDQPLFATAPDGDSRLFVVEKGGLINHIGSRFPNHGWR